MHKWLVIGLAGKKRDVFVGQTFVEAATEELARRIGKSALNAWVRGSFGVIATEYRPWEDRTFREYIRRVDCG